VPELIQDDFTSQALAAETKHLLTSPAAREEMKREFGELRNKMGPGGAIDRAAEVIAGMLRS
jgi:lipid A disaccharide synthetase